MRPVYLRSLEMSDLDNIHKWMNNELIYEYLGATYRPASRNSLEEWLQSRTAYSTNEYNFAICRSSDDVHIGNVYLRNVDWMSRSGEITGIFIGDMERRNAGLGRHSGDLILEYGFVHLGLNRMWARIVTENKVSMNMAMRCGLEVEGIMKEHLYRRGQFLDVAILGILRTRYFSLVEPTSERR